jgi:hypothetical protein
MFNRTQRELNRIYRRCLFAHLGIEYTEITEKTKTGKLEKEVLRKIK